MRAIDKAYSLLVNRQPGIKERYKRYRLRGKKIKQYGRWFYLLGLNFSYYVLRNKKLAVLEKYPFYEEKLLYAKDSESSLSYGVSPKELAGRLATYDIISFDVFDTLMLRPFSSPEDVFYLLEDRLSYPDFHRLRKEMEWKAREKKYKKEKHYEVTLEEIYDVIARETGIDKTLGMQLELEVEKLCCFANPYMERVVSELRRRKKRMIICSDMYLSKEHIRMLLASCGYQEFFAYYVSSDWGKSKSRGDLFELVKEHEGGKLTYIHVGDNYKADVEQCEKHGLSSCHYHNVNDRGMAYRAEDMSVITGGLYRGIVNAELHSGLFCYSREYEYGYIYGGLFVTGYCRFIHHYIHTHKVDKMLFFARDGDVLLKAYERLYPQDIDRCVYVYWSRLVATKLAARHFKYDYIRRFLYHKINQGYSIRQIFETMELSDMTNACTGALKINETDVLTNRNVEQIKEYLFDIWDDVLSHYKEQSEAGRQYYKGILAGCKNAVAVDIGWAGSGAITLDYMVNQEWDLNCDITGIIAGTNTCHNAEPNISETFLQKKKLVSYLYSQRENRDIWKLHDPGKGHNLYWELLLCAPVGSFRGFYLDENGKCCYEFGENIVDIKRLKEMQEGILNFVGQLDYWQKCLGLDKEVSGRDAYAPMVNVEANINEKYIGALSDLTDEMNL